MGVNRTIVWFRAGAAPSENPSQCGDDAQGVPHGERRGLVDAILRYDSAVQIGAGFH